MDQLIKGFYIAGFWCFILKIFLISITVRIFFSLLRAFEYRFYNGNNSKEVFFKGLKFRRRFIEIFIGISKIDPTPDIWYNFILGTIELFCFPILMGTNSWPAIGAWIAFKALAQWNRWIKNRLVFNRFLIANAIIIIASYLFLLHHINPKT